MKPRTKKKKLKKRFPFSDEWKPSRTGYRERLHSCPVCGKSRRSGFYKCCASCFWVLEWHDKVREFVEQVDSMMRDHDAHLRVDFSNPKIAHIVCEIKAFCDPQEVTETHRNGERLTGEFKIELKSRNFMAVKSFYLSEIRDALDPKKMLLDNALYLFREVKETVDNYIDRNGKMATICGVPIPVVGGSWGEPRRKDRFIFKRR